MISLSTCAGELTWGLSKSVARNAGSAIEARVRRRAVGVADARALVNDVATRIAHALSAVIVWNYSGA